MPDSISTLKEDVLNLYREPSIGATYANTYGEENIRNLVGKYRSLSDEGMREMRHLVIAYSKSSDLAASFISMGVLHALGMAEEVEEAYCWAEDLDEAERFTHHFDIGKSVAEHFT